MSSQTGGLIELPSGLGLSGPLRSVILGVIFARVRDADGREFGCAAGRLIVMDRGLASEAKLAWLGAEGYRYLVVSRERERQFDPRAAVAIEAAAGEPVH